MSTVSIEQMRPKLLTLEQVTQQLQKTEPLASINVNSESQAKFKLDPDWGTDIDAVGPLSKVGALVRVDGADHQLTKGAILQAFANIGLTEPYVKKTPAALTEPLLNYAYGSALGDRSFNALSVAGDVVAFAKPTISPFSNLQLLEHSIQGIENVYGKDVEILADYKFHNSLKRTDVRLIIPGAQRVIHNSGMNDLADGTDLWSAGLHLSNSLTGKSQTTLEAYLFRWWCTNGATSLLDQAGVWSRKSNGQTDDVYGWARDAVNEIFEGMEGKFNAIQALTDLDLKGNSADILRSIFEDYRIPVAQRRTITEQFMDSTIPSTMYGVMNVITEAANDEGVTPDRGDMLMRIGGLIPSSVFDTRNAQVWREGHQAEPEASNPYEIVPVA